MFWARWKLTSFFPRDFLHFLKIFSFRYGFFFCLDRWNLLCQPSLRNHGHYFSKGLSQSLLTYRFKFFIYHCPSLSLLFVLVWRFFLPESSLAQLFTSVNGSLLFATQPVLFLKRLLSTGVVKRQHLHSTRCRVFFTLGSLLPAFHRICIKKLLLFFWRRPLWNMAINGLMFLEKKTYQWRYVLWLCLIFYLYLATFKTLMERNTYFCSRVNGDILRSVSYRAGFSLPVVSFCTLLLIHCRSLKFFF